MRRPGENAAARYQRQYRNGYQRKRNIRNVMAFLHPCTVYSKQVTHSGISQHEQILDQAASSSADMVADARI
jgi:hypothetical protein